MSYQLDRETIEHYLATKKYMNRLEWVEDGPINQKSKVVKWKIKETVYVINLVNPEEVDEELSLRGSIAMKQGGVLLNLSLLLKHPSSPIERADLHHQHRNPDRVIISRGHKHEISKEYQDDVAFKPTDVNWDSKPDEIIMDILKEWNIELRAKVKRPSSYENIHQLTLINYFMEDSES